MKKLYFIFLACIFAPMVWAADMTVDVEEVEMDSKLVNIIRSFIMYAKECSYNTTTDLYATPYPKDNMLICYASPYKGYPYPKKKMKGDTLTLTMDFFPDEIEYHLYNKPDYVSSVQLDDSIYNVYIIIDKEDEQWWKKKSHSPTDVFVPSGKKVSVVQLTDEQKLYEYDPPYMQIWCLPGCFDGDRHLYYVDWKNTNYCR